MTFQTLSSGKSAVKKSLGGATAQAGKRIEYLLENFYGGEDEGIVCRNKYMMWVKNFVTTKQFHCVKTLLSFHNTALTLFVPYFCQYSVYAAKLLFFVGQHQSE